jgi:hypothetical protein
VHIQNNYLTSDVTTLLKILAPYPEARRAIDKVAVYPEIFINYRIDNDNLIMVILFKFGALHRRSRVLLFQGGETDRPALAGGVGLEYSPGAARGAAIGALRVPIEGCRSMRQPWPCRLRKLPDCSGDPKPSRRPGAVTIRREFVGVCGAF